MNEKLRLYLKDLGLLPKQLDIDEIYNLEPVFDISNCVVAEIPNPEEFETKKPKTYSGTIDRRKQIENNLYRLSELQSHKIVSITEYESIQNQIIVDIFELKSTDDKVISKSFIRNAKQVSSQIKGNNPDNYY